MLNNTMTFCNTNLDFKDINFNEINYYIASFQWEIFYRMCDINQAGSHFLIGSTQIKKFKNKNFV